MLRLPQSQRNRRARSAVIKGRPGAASKAPAIAPYRPSPTPLPVSQASSSFASVEDVASRILLAYALQTGTTNARQARSPGLKTRAHVRAVAAQLQSAGRSPEGYVEYVCTRFAKRNGGRMPVLLQVCGPAALEGWLPEYARNVTAVLPPPVYTVRPEQRSAYYARHVRADEVVERVWARFYPGTAAPSRPAPRPLRGKPGVLR